MRSSHIRTLFAGLTAVVALLLARVSFGQDERQTISKPQKAGAGSADSDTTNDNKIAKPQKSRVKVTISEETTFITEPLRDDGYPDYVRYIDERLSRGVTPENNATVLLLRAIGPAEISEEDRIEFFKRLGIEPLPAEADYFVDWPTYSKRFSAKDWPPLPANLQQTAQEYFESLDDVARSRAWTQAELPPLAQWLKTNNKHIDQLVEASKRPRMYAPLIAGDENETLIAVLLPHIAPHRQAAHALVTRAMYRAGSDDFDGALADFMACHRLARLTGQGFTLVEGLVAIAVDHVAIDAETALIAQDKLTTKQRAALRKELDQLPRICSMADVLDRSERFFYLDSVCAIARKGPSGINDLLGSASAKPPSMVEILANLAGDVLIDWDNPLKAGNVWYDRIVKVARIEAPRQRLEAMHEIERDVKATAKSVTDPSSFLGLVVSPRSAASQKMANVFVSLLLPALTSAITAERRNETKHTLLRLGIALADYRDEHKQFPESLEALSPKHVDEVPLDPMWGEPFVYRKMGEGYLLYALGTNGQDDGGQSSDDSGDADDLVIAVPAAKR